jgi:outer membrane protein assembly factor BamB
MRSLLLTVALLACAIAGAAAAVTEIWNRTVGGPEGGNDAWPEATFSRAACAGHPRGVVVYCSLGGIATFDAASGAPVWNVSVGFGAVQLLGTLGNGDLLVAGMGSGPLSRVTPCTGAVVWSAGGGKHPVSVTGPCAVVASHGTGEVAVCRTVSSTAAAFNATDGTPLWATPSQQFGPGTFTDAGGGAVFINCCSIKGPWGAGCCKPYAVDAASGATLWQLDDNSTSPEIIAAVTGERKVFAFWRHDQAALTAVHPRTGAVMWRRALAQASTTVTAAATGADVVVVAAANGTTTCLLRINFATNATVWTRCHPRLPCQFNQRSRFALLPPVAGSAARRFTYAAACASTAVPCDPSVETCMLSRVLIHDFETGALLAASPPCPFTVLGPWVTTFSGGALTAQKVQGGLAVVDLASNAVAWRSANTAGTGSTLVAVGFFGDALLATVSMHQVNRYTALVQMFKLQL